MAPRLPLRHPCTRAHVRSCTWRAGRRPLVLLADDLWKGAGPVMGEGSGEDKTEAEDLL